MGKYDSVLKSLEREVRETDGDFREKVEELKKGLEGLDAASLASAYAELRAEKDEHAAKEKVLNTKIAAVEEALWTAMENADVSSLKLKSGASVRIQPEPVAQVVDKDGLLAWVKANGMERLLTLPWQTVNSLVKERLLAGDTLPDGVEARARTKTVFSRPKS